MEKGRDPFDPELSSILKWRCSNERMIDDDFEFLFENFFFFFFRKDRNDGRIVENWYNEVWLVIESLFVFFFYGFESFFFFFFEEIGIICGEEL